MRIEAVIFDMDGVLVDSIDIHYRAWRAAVAVYGAVYPREHLDKMHGKSNADIAKAICMDFCLHVSPKKLGEEKHLQSYRLLAQARLFPGTIKTLRNLAKRKIKMGIATSSNRATLKLMWEKFRFKRYFIAGVSCDDVKKAKPAPDLFLLCAKRLRARPELSMVVEDSYLGIEAAKRAGMTAVAITNTYPRKKLRGADKIISTITELIDYVDQLEEENGQRQIL